jgi:hypothetical protein
MDPKWIAEQIPGLYQVIPLQVLRRTKGVDFDIVPILKKKSIAAVDRVIHKTGAISPGSVGEVKRPWYMHPHQEDHLLVMHGERVVELWSERHPRIVRFHVSAGRILRDGKPTSGGPAMLAWPVRVFHRIQSDPLLGSASLNFAARHPGYDVLTNFNIYDLNPETGESKVIREGYKDQPEDVNRGA